MGKYYIEERENVMKKIIAVIFAVFAAAAMAGCGRSKLPEGFDKDTVLTKAEEVITAFNEQRFGNIVEITRDDLKGALSETVLSAAAAYEKYTAPNGAFKEFRSSSVLDTTDEKTDTPLVSAVVVAVYEKGRMTYTITFDENMELEGFYLK